MTEGERRRGSKSPEYWDGHDFEDGCEPRRFRYTQPPFADREGFKLARQIILESAAMWPLTVPTRIYALGEEFDARSVAPGTVLNINREHLLKYGNRVSRLRGDYMAVVMNTTGDSSERVIYRMNMADAAEADGLILVEPSPVIVVGDVFHSSENMIDRINRLSIAWGGKGVSREVFSEDTLPQGQIADQKI